MKPRQSHRFFRLAIQSLFAAFVMAAPAGAADLLYLTTDQDKVMTYDISLTSQTAIENSARVFASTNLSSVRGLAFDQSGTLYVANNGGTYGNTISKFDSSGAYTGNITSNLSQPFGMAMDAADNLFVTNISGSTISKYNASGVYQSNITSNLNVPTGIAFDASGNLYAANYSGNSITKYSSSGSYISSITSGVSTPYGLAFDASGKLYVSRTANNNVTAFDSAGTSQGVFATVPGPRGMTFDSAGNFYVASGSSNQIFKYNAAGTMLLAWSVTPANGFFMAIHASSVPEPSTYALGAIATGVMAIAARRRNRNQAR